MKSSIILILTIFFVSFVLSDISCSEEKNKWLEDSNNCKAQTLKKIDGNISNVSWTGNCNNGLMDGKGFIRYEQGEQIIQFEGEMKNGFMDNGILINKVLNPKTPIQASAKIQFKGKFKNNNLHGIGELIIYTTEYELIQRGEFIDGILVVGTKYSNNDLIMKKERINGIIIGETYDSNNKKENEGIFNDNGDLIEGIHYIDGEKISEGKFIDNKLIEGIKYINGVKYKEGVFSEGNLVRGTIYFSDGDFLRGDINENETGLKPDVKGYVRTSYKDHVYEGEILNGVRVGQGVLKFLNGAEFGGEWKDDVLNGKGFRKYKDGNVYEGSFKDGYFEGNGTYKISKDEIYIGKFVNGQFISGQYFGENGFQIVGEFKDFVPHGICKYTMPGLGTTEGKCINGKREGDHSYIADKGFNDIITFKNGEIVSSKNTEYNKAVSAFTSAVELVSNVTNNLENSISAAASSTSTGNYNELSNGSCDSRGEDCFRIINEESDDSETTVYNIECTKGIYKGRKESLIRFKSDGMWGECGITAGPANKENSREAGNQACGYF